MIYSLSPVKATPVKATPAIPLDPHMDDETPATPARTPDELAADGILTSESASILARLLAAATADETPADETPADETPADETIEDTADLGSSVLAELLKR